MKHPLQIKSIDHRIFANPDKFFWDYKFPTTYATFYADCPKGFRVHEDLMCGE